MTKLCLAPVLGFLINERGVWSTSDNMAGERSLTHTHTHTYTHTHAYTHTHVHTHERTHIHTHTYHPVCYCNEKSYVKLFN